MLSTWRYFCKVLIRSYRSFRCHTVGLEPYIGFIHRTHTNKAPLIYDLEEPFRWIVEKAVLGIIFENKVSKSDFITTDEVNVRLKQDVVKTVLDEIAK